MYVIVHHDIRNPETAFPRGQALIDGDGAPARHARPAVLSPAPTARAVTCLWESASVDDVQRYADKDLGDASINTCYEVNAEQAFAERPLGLAASPAMG